MSSEVLLYRTQAEKKSVHPGGLVGGLTSCGIHGAVKKTKQEMF